MVLIQLLLPANTNGGHTTAPLEQTRRELVDRFHGVTAYLRSPAKGLWTSPEGQVEADDVVMVEVVVQTFDRPWWRAYVATLATRFDQESIHVRALPVETPEEDIAAGAFVTEPQQTLADAGASERRTR
ncbi:MAG: hypothetical protein QM736_07470 [Vicinamibacterales bacterium]